MTQSMERLRAACRIFMAAGLTLLATSVGAADIKVAIGTSDQTGFAPLTLAREAGIFAKHGLDVTLTKIPETTRSSALVAGDIQCAAAALETWIVWASQGVKSHQILELDKSYGSDGLVVRNEINTISDLKGKTIATSASGTSSYFLLSWILAKNGLTARDVTIVDREPGSVGQTFVAGQSDAAVTYEPYLSALRARPDTGKILATTLDYPVVVDTLGCTPNFLASNATAGKALAESYFEALDLISADPTRSFAIMGAGTKQTGQQFSDSAAFLRWQDKGANQVFFSEEWRSFSHTATAFLLETGVISQSPNLDEMVDASFVR